jgi:hypothetical protein
MTKKIDRFIRACTGLGSLVGMNLKKGILGGVDMKVIKDHAGCIGRFN